MAGKGQNQPQLRIMRGQRSQVNEKKGQGSGYRLLKNPHPPCHSEAGFIGEESALPPAAKQQIPRATIPRFGMTNPL
jgi:hypothetical protein